MSSQYPVFTVEISFGEQHDIFAVDGRKQTKYMTIRHEINFSNLFLLLNTNKNVLFSMARWLQRDT
jgi:hypothetical protein